MTCLGLIDAMRTTDLPPTYRLVWQCLENRANGARFWVGTGREIAGEIGADIKTVKAAVAELSRRGIVAVERRPGLPSIYRMLRTYQPGANPEHPNPPPTRPNRTDLGGGNGSNSGGGNGSTWRDHGGQNNPTNRLFEGAKTGPICKSPPRKKDPPRVSDATASEDARVAREAAAVIDAWDRMASQRELPLSPAMTETRRAKLRRRIAENGSDAILAEISRIGRDERGPADFDRLLQMSTFARVAPIGDLIPDDVTRVWQAWNDKAPEFGLATVRFIGPARRKRLAVAIRDAGGPDLLIDAIERLRTARFARGESGPRRWRFTFDHLAREECVTGLFEGKYDRPWTDPNRKPGKLDWLHAEVFGNPEDTDHDTQADADARAARAREHFARVA